MKNISSVVETIGLMFKKLFKSRSDVNNGTIYRQKIKNIQEKQTLQQLRFKLLILFIIIQSRRQQQRIFKSWSSKQVNFVLGQAWHLIWLHKETENTIPNLRRHQILQLSLQHKIQY